MTDIVFIILNYNSYEDTIRVVNEILTFDGFGIKVIVVDNNSPNNSYELLRKEFWGNYSVDVINSQNNGGYARGNNFGLRYAKKYKPLFACIINNDVHFTKDTISYLMEIWGKLSNPAIISPVQTLPGDRIATFQSLSIPSFLDDIIQYFPFIKKQIDICCYSEDFKGCDSMKVDYVPGAFLFTKYDLFESLDFFDEETFLFGEEKMLAKKIKDNGLNCYIIPSQTYLHEHSKTINKEASLKKQRQFLHKGRIEYARKYRNCPNVCILLLNTAYLFNILYFGLISVIKHLRAPQR